MEVLLALLAGFVVPPTFAKSSGVPAAKIILPLLSLILRPLLLIRDAVTLPVTNKFPSTTAVAATQALPFHSLVAAKAVALS